MKDVLFFYQVIAIDHSGRLLDAALKLQQGASLGMKCSKYSPFISIPLNEIEANIDRVQFQQVSVSCNQESVLSETKKPRFYSPSISIA